MRNINHNERWYICFYIVSEINKSRKFNQWKCHLVEKIAETHLAAAGGVDVCSWIKFSNSWHKQLFQMSQYLLGNNTFSPRTTFVNETNTFYQHVDRSPPIWLRGPHKGSQAKLQYFSKRPLGFLLPIIIWMLVFFWRSSICILMLCPCSI